MTHYANGIYGGGGFIGLNAWIETPPSSMTLPLYKSEKNKLFDLNPPR